MPLILAVEPDRRQATYLSSVLRDRPRTELVIAESAARALDMVASRVPDVLLTSPLLSPQDESVLAEWLRGLGTAAAQVQALTIPILASSTVAPAKPRGMMSVLRRRRSEQHGPSGCEPDKFAEQVDTYLERRSAERQIVEDAETLAIAATSPEPRPEPEPMPVLAVAPEPEPEPTSAIIAIVEPAAAPALERDSLVRSVRLQPDFDGPPKGGRYVHVQSALDPQPEPLVAAVPEPARVAWLRGLVSTFVRWRAAAIEVARASKPAPVPEPSSVPAPSSVSAPTAISSLEECAAPPDLIVEPLAASADEVTPPIDDAREDDAPWVEVPLQEVAEPILHLAKPDAPPPVTEDVWVLPSISESDLLIVRAMRPTEPVQEKRAVDPQPMQGSVVPVEPAKETKAPPIAKKKAPRAKKPKPVQDEWGFFDPEQCGFAALLSKLDEITEQEIAAESRDDTTVRVIAY